MIFVRPIGSISCVRVAAATLALSPMAPKRRRLSSKASAQAHRNKVCNRNRRKRRDALGKLNQLTTDLDLPIPKLNAQLLLSVLKCRGQPKLKLIDHIRAGSDFILHTGVQEHSGVLKCVKWFSMFWFYLCDS